MFRVGIGLVGKAEESRFHAESQQYQYQCRIGIHVRHYAITARYSRDDRRIERHQQIIQKPSDNAAQSVDCRIFSQ